MLRQDTGDSATRSEGAPAVDTVHRAAKKVRIGDLLVERKIISEAQLQTALVEQRKTGRKLGRIFIENGYIEEEELLRLLARQIKVPYLDLTNYEFDAELVNHLPESHARRCRALVLKQTPDGLLVGMGDPTDIFAYDELVRLLKVPVQPAIVKESDLLFYIDRLYQRGTQLKDLANEVGQEFSDQAFAVDATEADGSPADAPVVRLIQTIFEEALKLNASDIHIEPDEKILRIRRRIDGVLHEQVMNEKHIAPALISRLKLMAGADISERRLPQDGRFSLNIQGKDIDVRLATVPTQHGETVVMRLLDHSGVSFSLDRVGMSEEVLTAFRKVIHKPHGLVLVTGPTGSGKTTTLYAALSELNKPQKKIITVEDPVEYQLPRINQVQVNPKIGLNFARVLRTTLRLDPDIILVGEIRDTETGEIALRAAMTGHLVFSTLHTNDAISSVVRLIDMGMESYLVASSTRAILAQRLLRRTCEKCRAKVALAAGERAWLQAVNGPVDGSLPYYKGSGCNYCNHTGYRGRIGVYELVLMDDMLVEALRRGNHSEFEQLARNQAGFRPLLMQAIEYARSGVTTVEEAMLLSGGVG